MTEKIVQKELFDKIYEPKMSLGQLKIADSFFNKEIIGTLEVIARDDSQGGKIVHHEQASPNKVLVWAKHCMAKMMAGDIMARYGANRMNPFTAVNDSVEYGKGTIISSQQFFDSAVTSYTDTYNYTASNFTGFLDMRYPYFPTKMLFGTGYGVNDSLYPGTNDSAPTTPESTITDQTVTLDIANEGWVQAIHGTGTVSAPDVYGESATIGNDWDKCTQLKYKTDFGNWLPAFVFMRRSRPYESTSDMLIDKYVSTNYEYNKITYTTLLPSQLTSKWYPYNEESGGVGLYLKYAGLFCDAAFLEYNGSSETQDLSTDPGRKFSNGILWAKRAITPVMKSSLISIQFIWTIYMPREI